MPTPYEFGLHVGTYTKTAAEKSARGILADMALYSNPFTGVPTAAYDTYNHLRNGRYMGALGSVAAGGFSALGGGMVGAGIKGLGGTALRAGTRLGTQTALGSGLATAGQALRTGSRAFAAAGGGGMAANAQNVVSRGIQKVLPVRAGATFGRAPVQATANFIAKKPFEVGAMFHHSDHMPRPQLAR
jgi:hypothetical protein